MPFQDIFVSAASSWLASQLGRGGASSGPTRKAGGWTLTGPWVTSYPGTAEWSAAPQAPKTTEGGSYMGGGSNFYIPPGGFAGFSQMTPASQAVLSRRVGGGRRRRKAKKAAPRKRASGVRRKAKKAKKFVKGSAAARRHMAKLRALRK